ncbi:MAG: hypothetical protein K6E90_10355, partial [Lachnospiraceae bacterium]|nr:hypothetical protein [Lachnospiraceae bacterium]
DDSLAGISDILNKAISEAQSRYTDLINSLSSCLQVVNNDRAQLQMASGPEQAIVPGASGASVQVPNRGPQAQGVQGQGRADIPKAPVIDRSASIREEINDDDIDDI